jgi:hypothetical protein
MFPYTLEMLLLFHTKSKETVIAIVTELLSGNLFQQRAFGFASGLEERSGLG